MCKAGVVGWAVHSRLMSFLLINLAAAVPCTALAQGSVSLAWDPSTGSDVAGYNVYYGIASHSYTNFVSVGNNTNATIPGLIPGTTYFLAATAYDTLGLESDFSNETNAAPVFTVNQPPTLNPISNVTIKEDSSSRTI